MKKHLNSALRSVRMLLLVVLFTSAQEAVSQTTDIYQLMERTDLKLQEVEKIADTYFKEVGTGRGTGFKQYQRWLYERKFHTDADGNFIKPDWEDKQFHDAVRQMGLKSRSSLSWTELGPQAWTYTSGWNPGVGRITSVAVHPSDTTVIYVSSPGGGIWKSTNSGASWTPLIDFVSSAWMNVFNVYVDPNDQNTVYACLSSGGVLKSTDAGASWSATGSGPSSSRQVKVFPGNSNLVFAAAGNGIWRSANGGASWTQVQSQTKEDIEFNPTTPGIMYASGNSGTSCVWRSTDTGLTWTAIGSGNGITNTGRTLLAVSAANPAVVYAVQANGSIFGRMYRSTDTGKNYTTTVVGNPSSGTNYFGYETTGTGTTGQATYDMAITANPLNANEVHIAGIICWRSTNGGTSFTAMTAWSYPNSIGYNHADVHALEWVNGTIYSGSDGGVYKSINRAGDWTDLSSGLGIRQFYRIACAKTDANVITTGAQDNGSSFRRSSGSWVDWLGADGMDNVISPTNAAIAIGTSQYGSIYKTTNSGASRTGLSAPASGNWITPLVMHPTTHDTVYGGWTGVWRSGNGGSSWTNISSSINVTLDVLAVAPSNTRYIYTSKGNTLYRTSDGGATWSSVTAAASITSIFVSKNDPKKIWITCNNTSSRVFTSTDMGSTFTNISSGLPTLSARSVVVDEDTVETIYVGMNIGVYYRDNINNTWAVHATGLPLVAINEVEIQKSGKKLRVATYGRGVWESDLQNTPQTCTAPTGLTSSSITATSGTVSWTAASGAVSYRVDYKLSSDTAWTTAASATTSTSQNLSGLNSSSTYNWRVRTNCSSSNSAYSTASFATLSACPAPINAVAYNLTSSGANVRWNSSNNALSYSAEYKSASSSTWTSLATSTDTFRSITGLSAGVYNWRVWANCSSTTSDNLESVFTIYCASAGSNTSQGYIDNIVLGSISRNSGSDGGYYNGTALSTNLKPGTQYNLTVSPGFSGGSATEYWRVYVDYNRNGSFADAGEQAAQKTTKNANNTVIKFTVPTTASLGSSRIRISMSSTAYQSSCASFTYGEVEDYSVVLTNTPGQTDPVYPEDEKHFLTVYPVPTSDDLFYAYYLAADQKNVALTVTNMQGKIIYQSNFDAYKGPNDGDINVSTWSSGIYFLQLRSDSEIRTQKFVITR